MKNLSKQIKALGAALLLLLGTSCNDNETDIGQVTEPDFQNFFERTQAANLNFYNSLDLPKSSDADFGKVGFSSLNESLNDQFYTSYQSFGLEFNRDLLNSIDFENVSNARTSSEITEQIKEIDNDLGEAFYVEMTAINEVVLENADQLDQLHVEDFVADVMQNEQLSDDEKTMLTSYLSSLASSLTFLENGGIEQIQNLLDESGYTSGRTNGCKVSVRDVLISGVYGLGIGAVRGAIVGGTAGTFTVPVLGTATGAVGGAVFGGAVGFLGGVIGGVVTQLASTCTRHSGYQAAACKRTISLYQSGLLNSLPSCAFNGYDFGINTNGSRSLGGFFYFNPGLLN